MTLAFVRQHRAKRTTAQQMHMDMVHFLAAVAVARLLEVPVEGIRQGLAGFRSMEGRQEIYEAGGYTIIRDCYNAGPESMAASLTVLGKKNGRRISNADIGESVQIKNQRYRSTVP